jgi:uncharacterized protein with beta-barrel porin domain
MGGRFGYGTLSYLAVLAAAFPVLHSAPVRAADLTVSTATTTPVATSTGNGTGPGNITVDTAGSIVVATPTAVTIDSSNNFSNSGSIASSIAANAKTIFIDLGQTTARNSTGTFINNSVITAVGLDPSNADYASSFNNSALSLSGLGTYTGNITNTSAGTLLAGGKNATVIAIRGNMVGDLSNAGTLNALGDGSYGILTTGQITGTVTTGGVIAAGGNGSIGAYFGGAITGTINHTGSILAGSGPQVALATNGIDLTTTDPIPAAGGLWVAANVTGGVVLAGNKSTTAQEALDPTIVTNQTTPDSSISIIGPAAALRFGQGGPATVANITIGANSANSNYSVISQGNITSAGSAKGTNALGIEVAGITSGGQNFTTTLSGGFWNQGGTINVSAIDANATGFHVGNYGVVSQFLNGGDLLVSTGDSTANTITGFIGTKGGNATGVLIDQFGSLPTFTNTGNITITSSGPTGTSYGILDLSGSITTFTNSGAITAGIPSGSTGKSVAIDLSANTAGVNFTNSGAIFGDVYLGGGANTFSLSNSTISGSVLFQHGASTTGSNTVTLDKGIIADKLYLGNGNHTLTLNNGSEITQGVSTGAGQTALTVNQSKITLVGGEVFNASTANFSSGSSLKFDLSNAAPTGAVLNATGAVNFAAGSQVTAAFTGILTSTQTYTLIQAGSLTSGSGVPLSQFATAPSSFLNSAQFTSTANSLSLIVRPKTAAELQLGPNATTVYNLLATPVNKDTAVATAIAAQGSQDAFGKALRQLLPDTSGASQQVALNTQDMAAGEIRRRLVGVAKNGNPTHASGDVSSFWMQAIGDYSVQNAQGEQQGFDAWGLGIAFGSDMPVGDHTNVGFSFVETWHSADLHVSRISPTQFYSTMGYFYGRSDFGQAYVQAIAGGGLNSYNQARHVSIDTTTRIANGAWKGYQYGGAVEAGYTARWDDYSITPFLRGTYLKMHEDGYTETGGGPAVNLVVGAKDPDASTRGAVGFTFDRDFPVYFDSYIEAEFRANYTREFSHSAITLNSAFASGGPTFTNVGTSREPNRFTTGFGIAGKDSYSSISLDYDVEVGKGYLAHIAAVTARFRF